MAINTEIQAVRPRGPIRITIPAAVAYDLKAFQKGIATLVERLGCRPCFSGADCTFQLERDFVINEKLEIGPAVALPQDPVPERLRVTLPGKVGYNLDKVHSLVANIAGRLGCLACCSGFDITFLHERELLINETLNVDRLVELVNLRQLR